MLTGSSESTDTVVELPRDTSTALAVFPAGLTTNAPRLVTIFKPLAEVSDSSTPATVTVPPFAEVGT